MIEKIKSHADISEIIEFLTGKQGSSLGTDYFRLNPCPFCNHKDCFTFYAGHHEKAGTFKCFSCEKHGDVIEFVQQYQNYEFKDALKFLADRYHIEVSKFPKSRPKPKPKFTNEEKQKVWQTAAAYYQRQLWNKPAEMARKYLMEKRGYTEETLRHFQVGFATGELRKYLENKGWKLDQLKYTGLVIHDEKRKFWKDQFPFGGIIFPHFSKGNILHFTYKFCIDRKGKIIYKTKTPSGSTLCEIQLRKQFRDPNWICYNQDILFQDEKAHLAALLVVEGEWDLLSVHEKGKYPDVIAIEGNTGDKSDQSKAFPERHYVMAFDHDQPGRKYTQIFGLAFIRRNIKHHILPFPKEYNDPDEWLRRSPSPTVEFRTVMENLQRYIPSGEDGIADPETKIFKQGGCYWMTKDDGAKKITNFTIDFPRQYIYEKDGEQLIEREFILTNETGEISLPHIIKSDQLVTLKRFQAWLMDCGYFELLQGSDPVLSNLRQYIHKREARRNVFLLQQIGYIKSEDIFLFGNALVDNQGRIIPCDNDGIVWQYETRGFKALKQDENISLPTVEKGVYDQKYSNLVDEITTLLIQNYGTESISLAIGWLRATLFSDIIFKRFGKFPLLFIYGPTESGKTTLVELILNLIGIDDPSPIIFSDSTKPGLYKSFEYNSNLPVWMDEHTIKKPSDQKEIERYYPTFRGVYNRTGRKLAIDASIGTRTAPIRSTLMISGENLPSADSVRNRCIIIELSKKGRDDNIFPVIINKLERFSEILHQWIRERMDVDFCKSKLQRIVQITVRLKKEGISSRTAENYAISAAFAEDLFLDHKASDFFFPAWLTREASEKRTRMEAETIINCFNRDLSIIYTRKDYITQAYFRANKSHKKLYFWGTGLFEAWMSYRARERHDYSINCTYHEWMDLLREENYFIGNGETVRFNEPIRTKKAVAVDPFHLPVEWTPILEDQNFQFKNGKIESLF